MEVFTQRLLNTLKSKICCEYSIKIIEECIKGALLEEKRKLQIVDELRYCNHDDKFLEEMNKIKYEQIESNFEEDPNCNSFYFIFHHVKKYLEDHKNDPIKLNEMIRNYKLYLISMEYKNPTFNVQYILTKLFFLYHYSSDFVERNHFSTVNGWTKVMKYINDDDDTFYIINKKTNKYVYVNKLIPIYKKDDFKLFNINNFEKKIKRKQLVSSMIYYDIKSNYFTTL